MNRVAGIYPYNEKDIILYKFGKNGTIKVYSKKDGYHSITKDEYNVMRKNPKDFLLIKKDTEKDPDLMKLSIQDQMRAICMEADILKRITKGKLNRHKTGSVAKTSLHLFYSMTTVVPEPIQPFESNIIEKCKNGAFTYAKKYKGQGYKYDFCSEYPSIDAAGNAAYTKKIDKYSEHAGAVNCVVKPVVFESTGRVHPETIKLFKRIAGIEGSSTSLDDNNLYRYWMRVISVTLQRGLARAFLVGRKRLMSNSYKIPTRFTLCNVTEYNDLYVMNNSSNDE